MEDEKWMKVALEEAESAMESGELPFGAVVVDAGKELARAQTRVTRDKAKAAHAENLALLEASNLYNVERPLTLYTNVEPCLMCLATATRCKVDRIVYGMSAETAENTEVLLDTRFEGLPEIEGGVLEGKSVELFERLKQENPDHFAIDYVERLIQTYSKDSS